MPQAIWGYDHPQGNPLPQYLLRSELSSSAAIPFIARGAVNGAAVANTAIFTPATRYYATIARIRLVTVANLSVTPSITIGANNPTYDDILPPQSLIGLTAANTYYTFLLGQGTGPQASVTAQVFCRVIVAATGAGVVYAFEVQLLGDYGG